MKKKLPHGDDRKKQENFRSAFERLSEEAIVANEEQKGLHDSPNQEGLLLLRQEKRIAFWRNCFVVLFFAVGVYFLFLQPEERNLQSSIAKTDSYLTPKTPPEPNSSTNTSIDDKKEPVHISKAKYMPEPKVREQTVERMQTVEGDESDGYRKFERSERKSTDQNLPNSTKHSSASSRVAKDAISYRPHVKSHHVVDPYRTFDLPINREICVWDKQGEAGENFAKMRRFSNKIKQAVPGDSGFVC